MTETPITPPFEDPIAGTAPGARTWLDRLASLSTAIAGAALIGMVAVQAVQVFARYVLNDSPGWTEPVALLLLSTAMSFGAAAGVHRDGHFSFVLLAHALKPGAQRVLAAIVNLVVASFGTALAWWGSLLLVDGLAIPMAGAPLPQSAGYLPLALGGALIGLFALARLPVLLRAHRGGER